MTHLKEGFKFSNLLWEHASKLNFIEEGPASSISIDLSIDEFDSKLRSSVNFSDPECFKAMILPLGLEELRAVVSYEVMNLQLLEVATRIN